MTHASTLRATLSRALRHLLPAALALATATCTQDSVGPSDTGVGYFTFRPSYELAGGASLAQFGIVADSIHIRLTRPVAQLVLDTTVFFPPDSTELRLALPVDLQKSPDTLDAVIEMTAGGVVIFRDSIRTEVLDGPPDPSDVPLVTFTYVGPGTDIRDLFVLPGDTTIFLGDTLFFSATAVDSSDADVTSFYVGWSTSDTSIAKINAAGRLIAPNTRGAVRVVGVTPTGVADSTTVIFAPTPVIVTTDSGNAQSAPSGDSLPALLVARVKAADSLGIAGIAVHFVAVTAGGAVRDTFVLTDSTGRAKTRALLGLTAGAYTYTATAVGTALPAATFTATATASVPTAIAIQGGDAQVDTVAQLLPLPLVVHVTDAFTNPVAGVPVLFATVFGDGTVADDTVLTDASGNASIGYTLGISIGTDSITATIAGTSAFAIFHVTGIADAPAQTQEFGGGNQTIAAGTAYPESLVVKVFDTHDNPVLGAKVVWSIFSGQGTLALDTTLTDSAGRSANALTAGTVPGQLQVEARALPIVNGITITNFVTAAAPSAMTIGAGNGQSASGGTALPIPPTVHVVDAFGNVVPGVTVDFAVAAGGGTLDSATATTDSAGDANAGVWTLGPSAGGNQVRATIAALPGDTLVFDAVALPSGTTKLWTGAIDNLWSTAGNWSPAGMPIGGDNLFIPAGVTSPVLNTPTVTGGLAIEAGAAVTVTAGVTLQLSGDLDLDGDLTGAGNLTLTGSGTTLSGNISLASVLINGTLSLSGPTTIAGNLTLNTGPLTVGGQALTVAGNLSVGGGGGVGQLVMNNAADSVDVGGQFTVNSTTTGTGKLSAGVLVIRGDFTQNTGSSTNFAPSGTHTTRFLGTGVQTIVFATPSSAQSRFQNVEFGSPAGTTVNSTVTTMGTTKANAGTVSAIGRTINLGGDLLTTYSIWQVSTTLWGQSPSVYPDSLPRHITVFGPWTLNKAFKTDSSVTVSSGGILTLNGNALRVGTTLTSSGHVVMTSAADSLDVGGTFTVNSGLSGVGELSAGVLVLRGDFSQVGGSSSNFQPSGTHRVRFLGSAPQNVSFTNVAAGASRFMGVEFGNAAGITLGTNMYVAGPASVTAGTITGVGRTASLAGDLVSAYPGWQISTTSWVGTPAAYPDSLPRNVSIGASFTQNKPFKVDSAVSITGTGSLVMNGHLFRVGGAFTQTGTLVMQSTGDTLDVTGAIVFNSGSASTGNLTGGVVRVRGGFSQVGGSSANYAPSLAHVTRFEPAGGQSVSFSNPGSGSSHFQNLEVADSINVSTALYVAGAATLLAGGKVQSTNTATLAGPLTDPTDLGWRYQATNLSGTVTSLPDSLVTNVTLQGNWTLAQRTRITGTFAISATGTLDLNGDTLLVAGTMTQTGVLASSVPSGALGIGGLLTVNSGISGIGALTEGHLVMQNGFTQVGGSSSNFAPTVNFLTTFAGTGGHTVNFSNPGTSASRFHHLEVFDSLSFTSNLAVTGNATIDPAGRIVGATRTGTLLGTLADPSGLGWRVTNTSIPGGQVVPDSLVTNLTLTGAWTLPNHQWVDGTLTISSTGSLGLGSQRLDVAGAMTQTGELKMLQPGDTLAIGGLLTVNSGQAGTGDLIDGVLILHGGFFQQSGASSNFAADSAHLTRFVGTTGQPVSFTNANFAASHFHNVSVADSLTLGSAWASTGLVTVDSAARVIGAGRTATLGSGLVDDQSGWLVGTTVVAGTLATLPDSMITDLVLADTIQVTTSKHVVGDVTVQSTGIVLFIGGPQWRVTGDFTLSGRLSMQLGADLLWVDGNFLVDAPVSNTALYGRIYIGGDFQQVTGAPNNFAPAGPLLTAFLGTGPHAISFATPQSSYFAELNIGGGSTVTLGSDVFAADTLNLSSTTITTDGPQRLLRTQKLQVSGATFDKVRVKVNSPVSNAAQFDNVTFTNIDPTLTQLSLEFPGQTGDTIKLNNVAFSGTPTTGRYVYAADSLANDAVANIAFYNSTPLNGALYTGTEGSVGDIPNVLWSHLDWVTQPGDGTELLPLGPSPQVGVFDPSGSLVASFADTVVLAFLTNPGAAVLVGNVATAVGGVATFDSLTVSLAGAGYQLQAVSAAAGMSPGSALFTISVPLPSGTTTAFNNGGGDNDWFNSANWTFGVPDSADNIFVFPGQTVTVNAPASAHYVELGSGAGVVLNAPLTVDSSVVAGNTISGGGQLIARGTGELSGQVGDLLVTGAYTVPTGEVLTAAAIIISGASASLDPGQAVITSLDSLRTEAGGVLNVGDPGAMVTVGGVARFTGGTGVLTAGTLQLNGDFSQEENVGAFVADPAFVTLFTGGGTQTVSFLSPDSLSDHFGSVGIENATTLLLPAATAMLGDLDVTLGTVDIGGYTYVAGDVNGGGTLQGAGALQLAGALGFTGVYSVANTWFVGTGQTIPSLAAPYDTVNVLGTALLGGDIDANAFFVSGQLLMGGNRLSVTGDFGTFQTGQFAMTDPADSLLVGGNFNASGGPTTGLLTAGLLQVSGSFIQGLYTGGVQVEVQGPPPAGDAFHADSGHVTRLVGGVLPRLIYFDNPLQPPGSGLVVAGATSQFGTLELVDGTDSLASVVPVIGPTTVGAATVYGDGTLASVGKVTVDPSVVSFAPSSFYTGGGLDYQAAGGTYSVNETFFFGGDSIPVLPYQWLRVGFDTLALQGDLDVGNVTIGGQGEGAIDSYNGLIDLNGHALHTATDFTLAGFGTVRMTQPTDSLDVGGTFNANGGQTSGLVTDGVIVARGAVYVAPNWEDSSFIATGANRFRMAGAGAFDLGIIQGTIPANRFSTFTIETGTTANFNQYQNGALIVADSFGISGFLLQASPGQKVVALSDLYVGISLGITVDTVELHDELEVSGAGYSVLVTRYAGTGQLITPAVTYQDIEVTGTVAMDSAVVVNNDLTVSGNGSLDLGDVELDVTRYFYTQDNGVLKMTSPTAYLLADAASFTGGSTSGLLTAGTLRTRALIQDSTNSAQSYAPSGTHLTQIGTPQGGTEYLLQMASSGPGQSTIANLLLQDGGVGNVPTRVVGRVVVTGPMRTAAEGSGGVIGVGGATLVLEDSLTVEDPISDFTIDTLELGGAVVVPSSTFYSPVTRFAGVAQFIPDTQSYNRLEVTGTATLESSTAVVSASDVAILRGGRLTVGNGMLLNANTLSTADSATFEMAGPTAQTHVFTSAIFAGGSTAGLLRQGFLTLDGDLTQDGTNSPASFAVDSQMYTFFTNPAGQDIDFATPGDVGGSHLGFVNIQPNAVVNLSGPGTIPIWGELNIQGGATLNSTAGIDVAQNMVSSSGSSVTAPLFIFRTGSAPDPSTTWNVAKTAIFAPDTMNVPQLTYGGDLEIWNLGRFVYPVTIAGTLRIGVYDSAYASWSGAAVHTTGLEVIGTGRFGMSNATDSLVISGLARFDGGYLADQLVGGAIVFAGDVAQDSSTTTQSFGSSGTELLFTPTVTHKLSFASPDNSPWPQLTTGGLGGDLNVQIIGRIVVAGGGLSGNGLILSGDTLENNGPLDPGSSQLTVNLLKYVGPLMDQFVNLGAWNVTTTQFTTGGYLPYSDFDFDTLLVSDSLIGNLSQLIKATYVEVTGPGNPRHLGDVTGLLWLRGGDGNTDLQVTGNVVVRGVGAGITSDEGSLTVGGDLVVDEQAFLASNGSTFSSGASWTVFGDVLIDGASTVDSLVRGTFGVGGHFTQKNTWSDQSWAPDTGFTTVIFGGSTHVLTFVTPGPAGSGSHFGGLFLTPDSGLVVQTDTDLWVEGLLTTQSYMDPVLQSTAGVMRTINVQDVSIQGVTFDHLQLHLAKAGPPTAGANNMDIVNFTNFLTSEDQFLVDLPGLAAGGFSWSNFTFKQLATDGSDTGHYLVANDSDGSFPFLGISIGTNQASSGELGYYLGLAGATVTPFAP